MIVYCPTCEAPCSEKADTCPKCGHPLATPVDDKIISLVTLRTTKPYVIALVVLGVLSLVAYVYVNAPRIPGPPRSQFPAPASGISQRPSLGTLAAIRNQLAEQGGWRSGDERDAAGARRQWVFNHSGGRACVIEGTEGRIDVLSVTAVINLLDRNEQMRAGLAFPIAMIAKFANADIAELTTWATRIVDSAISHRGEEIDQHSMIDGKKLQIFAEWKDSTFELTMQVFCE